MADNQRDPKADASQKRRDSTTDDDLNREGITPGDGDTERERGYHQPSHGDQEPTDPDSAFSEVDRDDTIDD